MTAVAPVSPAEVAVTATPAAPARLAAVLAVVVALVGALLGPAGDLDDLFAPATAIVGSGTVERLDDGTWVELATGSRVPDGTTVRAPEGTAELLVPGGLVAMATGTEVVVDDPWRVTAGSIVVDGAPITLEVDGARATGDGTWRWDTTGRLGAYAGSAVVTDPSERETLVRSLEQVRVRDAVVTEPPRPYVYAGDDVFDRRHLADAIGVDDYLAALRRGLEGDYGTAPQPAAFYTDFEGLDGGLVAALGDVGFDRDGDRVGPPADVLLAAIVTDALVVDAALSPQEAATRARTQRLAGATWGVVAQGHDLDAGNVRAAAERALARRQQAEDAGTAVPPVTGDEVEEPATPGDDGPAGDTTTPPSGDDGSTPPGRDDGVDDPGRDPSDGGGDGGLVGSIVDGTGTGDAVEDLAGEEVGGLVDDIVGATDDLLDGPDADGGTSGSDSSGGGGLLDTTGEVVGGTVGTLLGN